MWSSSKNLRAMLKLELRNEWWALMKQKLQDSLKCDKRLVKRKEMMHCVDLSLIPLEKSINYNYCEHAQEIKWRTILF